jgi:hypothetical protein
LRFCPDPPPWTRCRGRRGRRPRPQLLGGAAPFSGREARVSIHAARLTRRRRSRRASPTSWPLRRSCSVDKQRRVVAAPSVEKEQRTKAGTHCLSSRREASSTPFCRSRGSTSGCAGGRGRFAGRCGSAQGALPESARARSPGARLPRSGRLAEGLLGAPAPPPTPASPTKRPVAQDHGPEGRPRPLPPGPGMLSEPPGARPARRVAWEAPERARRPPDLIGRRKQTRPVGARTRRKGPGASRRPGQNLRQGSAAAGWIDRCLGPGARHETGRPREDAGGAEGPRGQGLG